MVYMGSKNRISVELKNIIESILQPDMYYIEPFAGGMNLIDKINHPLKIANDKNFYLIEFWKKLQQENFLTENLSISEEDYKLCKENINNLDEWYVGFVGFCASYGGRFFEGFPRSVINGKIRDCTNEMIRNIINQIKNFKYFQETKFISNDYLDLDFENCVIYCDAPYKGTKNYKNKVVGVFDYNKYYDWLLKQKEKNIVLVSEYDMPKEFTCIWEKQVRVHLKRGNQKVNIERLYLA